MVVDLAHNCAYSLDGEPNVPFVCAVALPFPPPIRQPRRRVRYTATLIDAGSCFKSVEALLDIPHCFDSASDPFTPVSLPSTRNPQIAKVAFLAGRAVI